MPMVLQRRNEGRHEIEQFFFFNVDKNFLPCDFRVKVAVYTRDACKRARFDGRPVINVT